MYLYRAYAEVPYGIISLDVLDASDTEKK